MSSIPIITVVIPTFNTSSEKLLQTINSVLYQTEERIEVLVVDDGSQQPFSGIDKKIIDSRVCFIKNELNLGVAVSRNLGINQAKGQYIAFLDAGDWWEKEKLAKQLKKMNREPDLGLVFCGARFIVNGIKEYDVFPSRYNNWYRTLLIDMPITGSSSSVMIRTDVLRELEGFYIDKDIPEDRELWLRIAKKYQIDFVNEILVTIESSLNSRSDFPFRKEKTYKRLIEMYKDEAKKNGVYLTALSNYHSVMSHKFLTHEKFYHGLKHACCSMVYNYKRKVLKRLFIFIFSKICRKKYIEMILEVER